MKTMIVRDGLGTELARFRFRSEGAAWKRAAKWAGYEAPALVTSFPVTWGHPTMHVQFGSPASTGGTTLSRTYVVQIED